VGWWERVQQRGSKLVACGIGSAAQLHIVLLALVGSVSQMRSNRFNVSLEPRHAEPARLARTAGCRADPGRGVHAHVWGHHPAAACGPWGGQRAGGEQAAGQDVGGLVGGAFVQQARACMDRLHASAGRGSGRKRTRAGAHLPTHIGATTSASA